MKFKTTLSVRLIMDYLKDKLSDRERHAVEKEAMRDIFEEEAFEGLGRLSPEEFEQDVALLQQKITERTAHKKRNPIFMVFKIAASIVVLAGLVIAVRVSYKNKVEIPASKQIAVQKEMQAPVSEELNTTGPVSTDKETEQSVKQVDQIDQLAYAEPETRELEETRSEAPVTVEEFVIEAKDEELTSGAEVIAQFEAAPSTDTRSERSVERDLARKEKQGAASGVSISSKNFSNHIYKGVVTDAQGQPLPGVSILEKGTSNGVVSNINGEFEIKLTNAESVLQFQFLGYLTEEVTAENIKEGTIALEEDIVALNEVVVIGYGTQKKSDLTGAVSSIVMDDSDNASTVETVRAKPPTGNFISFKKYITENLNYSLFSDLTEKQKIVVEFMVYRNGSIGNFSFKQPADKRICNEIERIIKGSGSWKASTQNNQPIDSKVKMRLIIDPVAKDE